MFIDESIFRNKEYGAYVLRKKYYRITLLSFIISSIIVLLIFSIPLFLHFGKQVQIEHTRLRPTQVAMELLNIPPEILKQEKEKLPVQQPSHTQEQLPEAASKEEPLSPVITDTAKVSSTDTYKRKQEEDILEQEQEGIFECGSNLLNFRQWFMQNFQFPESNKIKKTEGRAIAVFIVNEEGFIDSVNIISGIDPLIDAVIKTTLLSSPRWKPCIYNGKRVKQLYHFPVYLVRKI